MGTNYYLQRRDPKTGRCRDVHICKTSYGWTPSMRGYRDGDRSWMKPSYPDYLDIRSWRDWKWFLLKETHPEVGGLIFNEYDEPISLRAFFKMINDWQNKDGYGHGANKKKNHAEEAIKGEFSDGYIDEHARNCWIDPEGYSFHDGDFS